MQHFEYLTVHVNSCRAHQTSAGIWTDINELGVSGLESVLVVSSELGNLVVSSKLNQG